MIHISNDGSDSSEDVSPCPPFVDKALPWLLGKLNLLLHAIRWQPLIILPSSNVGRLVDEAVSYNSAINKHGSIGRPLIMPSTSVGC